jgi:6-pyruvoyltetrahydropterin/6-carboxytetrahydropterin synthase
MIRLTRRYRFSASHRLHSDQFSEAENAELYGKCNHPYGHGHDYVLEVSVTGPVDPKSGTAVLLPALDELVEKWIVQPFEHRDLNTEVPEFTQRVPTSENLVDVIEERLKANWTTYFTSQWPRLEKIRLQETQRNQFERTI